MRSVRLSGGSEEEEDDEEEAVKGHRALIARKAALRGDFLVAAAVCVCVCVGVKEGLDGRLPPPLASRHPGRPPVGGSRRAWGKTTHLHYVERVLGAALRGLARHRQTGAGAGQRGLRGFASKLTFGTFTLSRYPIVRDRKFIRKKISLLQRNVKKRLRKCDFKFEAFSA